jgi:hypothetical protein
MIWTKPHHGYSEVETADFNPLIWNTKNSAGAGDPPIEKADEKHKRDLFGGLIRPNVPRHGMGAVGVGRAALVMSCAQRIAWFEVSAMKDKDKLSCFPKRVTRPQSPSSRATISS